jgi:hypothetical protein
VSTHRFVAAEWFAAQAPRIALLREAPIAGLEPWPIRGACMEPMLTDRDLIYLERGARPREGDLFAFECSIEEARAYTERTGIECGTAIAKLYLEPRPPLWRGPQFCCNESLAPLADRPVHGVVRAIRSAAVAAALALAGCDAVEMHYGDAGQISSGAVTQTVSASYTGTAVSTNVASPATAIYAATSITTAGGTVDIAFSSSLNVGLTGASTLTEVFVQILRDGSALPGGGGIFSDTSGVVYGDFRSLNLYAHDSPPAGAHTYEIYLYLTGSHGTLTCTTMQLGQSVVTLNELKR